MVLTLDGPKTVRVKAVDSQGRPVPNLSVSPFILAKTGKLDSINLHATTVRGHERSSARRSRPSRDWDWGLGTGTRVAFCSFPNPQSRVPSPECHWIGLGSP